ncbi:hypothetical protein F3Y22_tig00112910pilonHSYRG00066 [Hibiscus syriacus]|uniref:Uncharacterized protein n=1 Tax=Hibiscus syriacus TaxID=106335 RepID=A0A6A2X4M6_HIBSY|nr:hypothetical protein F3Y22_tig00112910pilonHSYRG00066 [Hibiscus syriacus]
MFGVLRWFCFLVKAISEIYFSVGEKPIYANINLMQWQDYIYNGSAKLTERICKALEACDDEPSLSVHKYILDECRKWNLIWVGRNKVAPFEPDEVEMLLEVAFYCLGIPLKTNVQELNDDRLEQLMSRFGRFDLVQSSEEHNGYNPDKENNQHGRGNNDASRLEPASRYNQSAGSDLFMAL